MPYWVYGRDGGSGQLGVRHVDQIRNDAIERCSLGKLHGEEVMARLFSDAVHLDDSGVREVRVGGRLAAKTRDGRNLERQVCLQDFEGHTAIQR